MEPTLVKAQNHWDILQDETFAPILYLIPFDSIEEAIALHNQVPQGLSSSLFTTSVEHAELFLSSRGSDCGIANINIGTSGAEIGGAFGGEGGDGGALGGAMGGEGGQGWTSVQFLCTGRRG